MMFKGLSRFLVFLFLACLTRSAFAAGSSFSVPQSLSSDFLFARDLVDVDLLKLQKQEIEEATKRAPDTLTPSSRLVFVSTALKAKNSELLKVLNSTSPVNTKPSDGLTTAITKTQANEILKMFHDHPVISDLASLKYDTPSRQIGYCFGRATFVHWELLRRGIRPSSIGKLFAIGGLIYEESGWSFHVATAVRNTEGGWLVIDALQSEVLTPENWIQEVSKWSQDGENSKVRLYFTDPVKFRPTAGRYSEQNLNEPYYNGYFKDLKTWFQEHPHNELELFKN